MRGLGKDNMGGVKLRHRVLRDNIPGITKSCIRRLARRSGVKRISGLIYDETRGVLKVFVERLIRDAVNCTKRARRKTVTAMDVAHALKWPGCPLSGAIVVGSASSSAKREGSNNSCGKGAKPGAHLADFPVATPPQQFANIGFRHVIEAEYSSKATAMIHDRVFITHDCGNYVFSLSNNTILKLSRGRADDMSYEVLMQYAFAMAGLGPHVLKYEMWQQADVEGRSTGIIMDRISDIMPQYLSIERSVDVINTYVGKVEEYLRTMCSAGLRHLDAHWDNWGRLPNSNPTTIDYGHSAAEMDPNNCTFELEIAQLARSLSASSEEGKKMNPVSRARMFTAVQALQCNLKGDYPAIPAPYATPEEYHAMFDAHEAVRPDDRFKTAYVLAHQAELQHLEEMQLF
jgi:histone H4